MNVARPAARLQRLVIVPVGSNGRVEHPQQRRAGRRERRRRRLLHDGGNGVDLLDCRRAEGAGHARHVDHGRQGAPQDPGRRPVRRARQCDRRPRQRDRREHRRRRQRRRLRRATARPSGPRPLYFAKGDDRRQPRPRRRSPPTAPSRSTPRPQIARPHRPASAGSAPAARTCATTRSCRAGSSTPATGPVAWRPAPAACRLRRDRRGASRHPCRRARGRRDADRHPPHRRDQRRQSGRRAAASRRRADFALPGGAIRRGSCRPSCRSDGKVALDGGSRAPRTPRWTCSATSADRGR